MRTPDEPRHPTPTRKRSRGALVLAAAACAFVLGTAGIVAALGRPAPSSEPHGRALGAPASGTVAPTVAPTPASGVPTPTATPTPSYPPPSPSVAAPVDPTAIADGTYPTFVRDVDADGATITVDVLQLFKHRAATRAAVEDGTPRRDARYLYIYLRNENDLLRTLPVARDVRIKFMGVCEVPASRHVALTQLSDATTPFSTTFYYAVTVTDGVIYRVSQHLAISAC